MRRVALTGAFGRRLRTDGHRATVAALTDVNLDLRDGDRLALLGPNGAGKSVLLRTMGGVYVPSAGTVTRSGRLTPLLSHGTGLDIAASGLENIELIAMHLDSRRDTSAGTSTDRGVDRARRLHRRAASHLSAA